jgi:hypothetical protein
MLISTYICILKIYTIDLIIIYKKKISEEFKMEKFPYPKNVCHVKPGTNEFEVISINNDQEMEDWNKSISPTNDLTAMSLFQDGNILMIWDNTVESEGEYNFSYSILPLFGTVGFIEVGEMNDHQEPMSMDQGTIDEIERLIVRQKEIEKENGLYNGVITKVNEIGKEEYFKEINERTRKMESSIEQENSNIDSGSIIEITNKENKSFLGEFINNLNQTGKSPLAVKEFDGLINSMETNLTSLKNMMVSDGDRKLIDSFIKIYIRK